MSLDTGSFDLKRSLPLDAATLWDVMTDPKHRENRGAPTEATVLTMERTDLRVGGSERHRCGPEEAPDFGVDTRWYHLDAPGRAAFTETVVIGEDAIFTSLISYVLSPNECTTELCVTVALSSFCGPDALQDVKAGWGGGLANLDRYIATLS